MAQTGDDILSWIVTPLDAGHLIAFKGEVDMSNATRFEAALAEFADGTVTIDFSQVTFIDSHGMKALVAARERIERRNGQLTVRSAHDAVLRAFEVYGLDGMLAPDGRDGH